MRVCVCVGVYVFAFKFKHTCMVNFPKGIIKSQHVLSCVHKCDNAA